MSTDPKKNDELKDDELNMVSGGTGGDSDDENPDGAGGSEGGPDGGGGGGGSVGIPRSKPERA